VWTGIGAVGTASLGIVLFDEPATGARLLFISVIVFGIVGLHLVRRRPLNSRRSTVDWPH